MGGNNSRARSEADGAKKEEQPKSEREVVSAVASTINSFAPEIEANMADGESDTQDANEEGLASLRVKDKEAWKGCSSPRPRSALKHTDSEASTSPSGRRNPRRVSFQANALAPPPEAEDQASKRVKGSDEFSMKYLVEKFYGRVTVQPSLKPFFEEVDMFKLKHQQEALMLLVFGGQELLDDELPGLSADLRLIHLHLLFEGLNLTHWQLFADIFSDTLDECHQIPAEVRAKAKQYMASTKQFFRPIEPDEWPPKVVYKGWTKRTCPFAAKRPASPPPDDDCFVLPDFHAVAANHHNNTANAPSDKATSKAEEPA